MMATQNELLRQLIQSQQMLQQQDGRQHQPHQAATYQDFLSTHPPLFTPTDDPLDADTWVRVMESKFALLTSPCSEVSKAQFAAQQLRGVARLWWDSYMASLRPNHAVTWEEFKTAFQADFVPAGILERKLTEFLELTQGNRPVTEYAEVFTKLSQYGGHHVDTDQKRMDRFRRGLNPKLRLQLNPIKTNSYGELVNLAITQEDCNKARQAEKKRKGPVGSSAAPTQRFRVIPSASWRPPPPSAAPGRWVIRPPQQSVSTRSTGSTGSSGTIPGPQQYQLQQQPFQQQSQ
jgi:hypothetical protein